VHMSQREGEEARHVRLQNGTLRELRQPPPGSERTSVGSDVDAGPDDEVVSRSGTVLIFIQQSSRASCKLCDSEDGS
jgi:hypothetical protein